MATTTMEFHIARRLRETLQLDDLLFSFNGNVVFANVAASRRLAQQLNELRLREQFGSQPPADAKLPPGHVVHAGALFAMGLIDELNHALVQRYRETVDPAVLTEAIGWFAAQISPDRLETLLLDFTAQFPGTAVFRGEQTATEWLRGTTDDATGTPRPHREVALEELMLLWLGNSNPAFKPFRELFSDTGLQQQQAYKSVTGALPAYFGTRPPLSAEAGSLLDALRAPMLASPDSLTGQLDFIRTHWERYLGPEIRRVLLAIDTLREEDIAIWLQFHPPGPDRHRHGAFGTAKEGFVGDEYMGFEDEWTTDAQGNRVRRYAAGYQAPLVEYEAFSADQAWMPNVVLLAKSTYVWLEQLSKKYLRHIYRLDQIPDEELQLMADRGITGLWLIGLWERSVASRTIKRLRGQGDAVASAYSLKEYEIAEDLGGNAAYENLRDRAGRYGLRLASDMVPNHMGIDSNWVIEHPDWFLYRWESPFPVYQFEGPDLSTDSRVEIKIEDHYYDQTDAAVVFRLRHHADGTTRYMYHGNDGTTFAWNDTAQLDYSKAAVREHVMQVILHVARLFPIIRFDAAMVLAKRHVQRLWFPLPGAGGSIPSRAENAMSQEEFDALMPQEFWREVVDRVAQEVPGTLLLAEAFWLLEGYFVRTLGMHRVYNSAFMVMLRDEENAKYRSYLKKTMEFDPDILKRYVNFMSNPDERTAIDQFGTGDKFFGVSTLLATLPGLPMLSHGQIEGFTERYGMEFKQARMNEEPNEGLIARYQHEIAPLLKNRRIFAESANFVLYDFWTDGGAVDENVFAFSNNFEGQRSLIVYNNVYGSTAGTLHISAGFMDKGSGEMRQRSLADGLALPYDDRLFVAYRDTTSNLEYLRRASDIHHHGLRLELRGYQYIVLLHWRELSVSAERPWDRLYDALNGAGVYSLEEALTRMRLRPVHEALRQALSVETLRPLLSGHTPAAASANGNGRQPETLPAAAQTQAFLQRSTVFLERAVEYLRQEDSSLRLRVPAPAEVEAAAAAPAVSSHDAAEPVAHLSAEPDAAETPLLQTRAATFSRDVEPQHSRLEAEPAGGGEVVYAVAAGSSEAAQPQSPEQQLAAAAELYRLQLQTIAGAALQLEAEPGHEHHLREVLVPALAWALVRALPVEGVAPAALFDRLGMRAALAELFTSLGVEGDQAWAAAARVRIALSLGGLPRAAHTDEFWQDGDVRWLAGVNVANGTTWFSRDGFEAVLVYLHRMLPLEWAAQEAGDAAPAAASAKGKASGPAARLPRTAHAFATAPEPTSVAEELHRAELAGYDLARFRQGSNAEQPSTESATVAESSASQPVPDLV